MRVFMEDGDVRVDCLDLRDDLSKAISGLGFRDTILLYAELDAEFGKSGLRADFIRNMCLVDRFFLLTMVLGREDLINEWQFNACREVEAEPDGMLDLWARGHGKSSIITLGGTIQELIRDRDISICIFSHKKSIAADFVNQIKNILEGGPGETLRKIFPDCFYDNPRKESPSWSVDKGLTIRRSREGGTQKERSVESGGVVDGQPTSKHYKLMIFDDLVTIESVSTPEQIQKTTEALSVANNLSTMDGKGRKWYIGTRYAYGDTYKDIIDRGVAKPRIKPATDDGTREGNPVFLTRRQWEEKLREESYATIACQQLLNPLAGGQRTFRDEWFMPYEFRSHDLNVYILVDPASSAGKRADKTAIAVVGVDPHGRKFLLDGYHHKMTLSERWKAMVSLRNRWMREPGVQNVHVGYERFGMNDAMQYFRENMMRDGVVFDIHELAHVTGMGSASNSKISRMSRLEPDMRNGRLFLPGLIWRDGRLWRWGCEPGKTELSFKEFDPSKPTKRMKAFPKYTCRPLRRENEDGRIYDLTYDFIQQARTVPFSGGHDDLVDAVSRIYDMKCYQLPISSKTLGSSNPDPAVFQ